MEVSRAFGVVCVKSTEVKSQALRALRVLRGQNRNDLTAESAENAEGLQESERLAKGQLRPWFISGDRKAQACRVDGVRTELSRALGVACGKSAEVKSQGLRALRVLRGQNRNDLTAESAENAEGLHKSERLANGQLRPWFISGLGQAH